MSLDSVFDALESALDFQVGLAARRRLFVRAGVVGWRGKGIIVLGRDRSGKSSLVAALVRAKATYYSDQYAVFDKQGRVHPYPKPLGLCEEGGERPKRLPVEALGGRPGIEPLPVGLIVVTEYQPGARWRPRKLSAGESALALLEHTLFVPPRSNFAFDVLRRVIPSAVTMKGKRGEAHEVVKSLLEHLELPLALQTPTG